MDPEEAKAYLIQHWHLYLAEEIAGAHVRAWTRVVDLAYQTATHDFMNKIINDLKETVKP